MIREVKPEKGDGGDRSYGTGGAAPAPAGHLCVRAGLRQEGEPQQGPASLGAASPKAAASSAMDCPKP